MPRLLRHPAAPVLAVLVLLWGGTVWQLSGDWEVYPHYNYGWLVPLLALYLAWRRWQDRPPAAPWNLRRWVGPVVLGALLLPWLPLLLVRGANPDWRLVGWVMALLTVATTLALLARAGGPRWAVHFAVPCGLILLAIPWPAGFEQAVIQTMTRWVSATTVEGLTWCGVHALREGNVILLSTGPLGVDEACSGIRSFQSNLMAALVVGELFRMAPAARVVLVLAGLAAGFLLNLARAFLLAGLAVRGGAEALAGWHDPAGYTILVLSFALLLGLARLLGARFSPDGPEAAPASGADAAATWPRASAWAAAVWLVFAPLAAEGWFRAHETAAPAAPAWSLDWDALPGSVERVIPDKVRAVLRYDEAVCRAWADALGRFWMVYEIEWKPARTGAQLARSHSPDICLPAAGAVLLDVGTPRVHRAGPVALSVTPYTFQLGGGRVEVFFTVWEHAPTTGGETASVYDHAARWRAVREGRRNRGQTVLHATLAGFASREEAWAAYVKFLDARLRVR